MFSPGQGKDNRFSGPGSPPGWALARNGTASATSGRCARTRPGDRDQAVPPAWPRGVGEVRWMAGSCGSLCPASSEAAPQAAPGVDHRPARRDALMRGPISDWWPPTWVPLPAQRSRPEA